MNKGKIQIYIYRKNGVEKNKINSPKKMLQGSIQSLYTKM